MNMKPPKIAEWVIWMLTRSGNRSTLMGDLEEEYRCICEETGKMGANFWYMRQIVKPFMHFIGSRLLWAIVFSKHYIKIAIRNIRYQKVYAIVNITGLAVGMAAFLLIVLFVRNEKRYDRFHEHFDRIYRIVVGEPGDKDAHAGSPTPLGGLLEDKFSEVEQFVRLKNATGAIRYKEKVFKENRIFMVDPSLFKVFTFPLLKGDPETALDEINSIILTESMVKKYFGHQDPLGQVLNLNGHEDLIVTGIAKDVPDHSHFHFDFLVPFDRLIPPDDWSMWNYYTYILIEENSESKALLDKIRIWVKAEGLHKDILEFRLQSLSEIHFQYIRSNIEPSFNGHYIQIFIAVAFIILILACINFINLSTA